ncbi:MAG: PolC-type DNA polymerase III, partial [Lachnospiraceae bacterium]|nr:PolC-type DNA polymerase III [Lachnospiraceae bacterium]
MEKGFLEVFPTLQLKKNLHDLMEQAQVVKVSSTKAKDILRIYVQSARLIQKQDIWTVEQEIKKQLFPGADMVVKIYERFQLSEQYTPRKLLELYEDSILEEIKEYSRIQYNALRGAVITHREDVLELELEDNVLFKDVEEDLVHVLQKIIVERCGMQCRIQVSYREPEESKFAQDDERMLQLRVDAIYQRTRGGGGAAEEGEQVSASDAKQGDDKAKPAISKESSDKKKAGNWGDKGKGDIKKAGAYKRSENPDVIFGRDFEEEAISIQDIVGEMGEVVIRG